MGLHIILIILVKPKIIRGLVDWLPQKNRYWVLVAHTYNPGYSGGRDQENHSSKAARQIV
jgi:hypothetical protein